MDKQLPPHTSHITTTSSTPHISVLGRILNRFSKDMGQMDEQLPISLYDLVQCVLLISGCVLVAVVVNPYVFIPVVPITVVFFWMRGYFIHTARNIKRLEASSRSPVFSHISASLHGLWTIRAYGVQEQFLSEFNSHQDLHTEAWFLFISANRWLALRLDWLGASFIGSVAFCAVFVANTQEAGLVGLSLTYAMALMGLFQWTVRLSAEVENQMVSVERVLEYTRLPPEAPLDSTPDHQPPPPQHPPTHIPIHPLTHPSIHPQMVSVERVLEYTRLPPEAPLDSTPDHQPPPTWPHHGEIAANDLTLKYSECGENVLRGLDFLIHPMEKIGVVGRTGAGKSSLLTALFRLVEPHGQIVIDGVDIQSIGLHDLRTKISIIPQDPMLFSGTVRKNLDPFTQYTDDDLWHALRQVQLNTAISDLPDGLDWLVSEEGSNFSGGQKQLMCLARAILKHSKILVIDEATANVDPRTDALIQETIREKFVSCTVITIAHRLHTVMDSDRIMVLDQGHLVEFDQPYTLLQNSHGFLYRAVSQCGEREFDKLLDISRRGFRSDADFTDDFQKRDVTAGDLGGDVLLDGVPLIKIDADDIPTGYGHALGTTTDGFKDKFGERYTPEEVVGNSEKSPLLGSDSCDVNLNNPLNDKGDITRSDDGKSDTSDVSGPDKGSLVISDVHNDHVVSDRVAILPNVKLNDRNIISNDTTKYGNDKGAIIVGNKSAQNVNCAPENGDSIALLDDSR